MREEGAAELWPELPTLESGELVDVLSDARQREERLQRLSMEQRGLIWNE